MAIEQRELRTFISGLKPGTASPAAGTLASNLHETAARLAAEWKTTITVRVTPDELELRDALEHDVRMLLHEAMVNALKHSLPSRVVVGVGVMEERLLVTVTDDGRGFPFHGRLEHDALVRDNLGPVSLRDRVEALGGRIAIDSSPRGSRVEVSLPL